MSIPTYNGKTIPVVTLRPDWVNPVSWGQQHSTTISEALDTSEERQSRFPRALYRLNYTTLGLNAAQTAYLRTIIETAEDLPVACPLWPLGTQLTAAAQAGETTLVVADTASRLFDVLYEYGLLWEDFNHWEVVELDTVDSSSCTLKSALGQSYSTEAILYPLAYGLVPRGSVTQLTDANGRWKCNFSETFHRLHDQSFPEGVVRFNTSACAVTSMANGGGDTFDCYYEGDATSLPDAGTAFSASWLIGNSPLRTVFRDTFDSYSTGDVTFLNGGTGWSGAWVIGDSP